MGENENAIVNRIIANDLKSLKQIIEPALRKSESNLVNLSRAQWSIPNSTQNSDLYLPHNSLTLLHIAAYANATECFLYLLNTLTNSIDAESAERYTPFHYACLGGAYEVASLFVYLYPKMKNDPNALEELFSRDYVGTYKYTLPYISVFLGSAKILQLIFDNGYSFMKYKPVAKKKAQDPIEHTIKARNVECLKVLLKYIAPAKSSNDMTPLMLAIINNQTDAIPILLESKCDPAAMTKDFKTALSLSCFQGNEAAVSMLLNVLPTIDLPDTIRAKGAVHWACQSHNYKIVEMILSKGVNVNRLDENGNTAPYYLLDVGQEDENIKIFELLREHGFDFEFHLPRHNSVLGDMLTCIKRQYKIIEWLLSNGADTNLELNAKAKNSSVKTIADFMRQMARNDKSMRAIVEKYLDQK